VSQEFWESVGRSLDEIAKVSTVEEVIEVLNRYFAQDWSHATSGTAFFPGSGGDRQLTEGLRAAGFTVVWAEASYYYVARDRQGAYLTYMEGDVYRGDRRPQAAHGGSARD